MFKVKLLDVAIHKLSDDKGGNVKELGGLVDRLLVSALNNMLAALEGMEERFTVVATIPISVIGLYRTIPMERSSKIDVW